MPAYGAGTSFDDECGRLDTLVSVASKVKKIASRVQASVRKSRCSIASSLVSSSRRGDLPSSPFSYHARWGARTTALTG